MLDVRKATRLGEQRRHPCSKSAQEDIEVMSRRLVDQIVKDYPGKFDVEQNDDGSMCRLMKPSVYKRPVKVSALGGQKFHAVVERRQNCCCWHD